MSSFSEITIGNSALDMGSTGWQLVQHYIQPIVHFWNDPEITSIAVNTFDNIWIRKAGSWIHTEARFENETHLRDTITQVIVQLGQTIDSDHNPLADGRFQDGSRLNAVLSPAAPRGSNMTIRIFPKVRYTLTELMEKQVMSVEMLEFLKLSVICEENQLISGATGSGKTTVLNALANLTPEYLRLGIIEDTSELNIIHGNAVYMEAPKRAIKQKDGKEIVTMEELLENVLRQELAALVVGEIRKPLAAIALMLALNTGHKSVKSTLHANNCEAAIRRVINMLLSTDTRIPYDAVKTEILENFNLIIQTEHTPKHGKKIVEIAEVADGKLNTLFVWDYLEGKHKRVWKTIPKLFATAERYGYEISAILR
jgi:pilus assembly protein CpaF